MRIQFWHIVVLLLVVLLLFGSSRLPELARSIGKSMKILKSEVGELRDDAPQGSSTDRPLPPAPATDEPPVTSRNASTPRRAPDRPTDHPQHIRVDGDEPGPRDR